MTQVLDSLIKEKNYLAAELDNKNAILGDKMYRKFRGMVGESTPTEKTLFS